MRHQVKSKWYYIFWSVCAVAVVGGQIYIATSYHEMSQAFKSMEIFVSCEK